MAAKARQQYYADGEYIDKQAREFQPTMEFKTKIDSIEPGAQVNIIEDIKVNGTSLEVDDKTVDISIPLVIDNLYSTDGANALSAKQGKVLYDLVQNLASRGRYLSNWNAATGLPTTNPVESHYQYRAGDYYVVSNVAAQGGTNYRPEPGEFVIGQASVTVETEVVKVTDMYLYDGTNWNLLINSTREIAIDSSLSTSSTNPVENRVVTNAINGKQDTLVAGSNIQIASDGKTISATDTTYTAGTNVSIDANNEISAVDTTYTAGANVQISNQNVISATDTVYSAGTNVQISNQNVISATDTTYSAGYGICIDNNNEISSTGPKTYYGECDPISEYCVCPSKFNGIQEGDYYESEYAGTYQYRGCNIDCGCYSDGAWEKIEKYALFDCGTTNSDSYDCKYILGVEGCGNSAYSGGPYVRRNDQWKTITGGTYSNDGVGCLCGFTGDTHYVAGQSGPESGLYMYGTSWYWLDRLDKDTQYRCGFCCADTLDYIRGKSECAGCPSDGNRYLAYGYVGCECDINDVGIGFYNGNYRCGAGTEICIINNGCSSSGTKTPIARIWKGCSLSSDQYDDVISGDLWWNQDCGKLKVYDYNCGDFVDIGKTYSEGCGICIDNDEISTKIGCGLTYGSSDKIEVSGCDVASMISGHTVSSVNGCLEIDQLAATCLLAGDGLYANPGTCMIDIDTTCVATQSDLSCKQNALSYYKECSGEAYISNDNGSCLHTAINTGCGGSFSVINCNGDMFIDVNTDSSGCYSYGCFGEDIGDTYIKGDDIIIGASQGCYLNYSQSDGMLDFSNSCGLKSGNENYTLNANASTDIARKSDISGKQDKATSGSTAPSTTPSYVGQQYVDTTADKMYVATGTSSSSDWTEVGAGSGDMLYSDFNWVTKTGATITLDLRSEITPSTDFTVNKPSTLEDGQYYILRVTSGATAYTMTLGTNVTNPYSEDLTLEASTIQQFTFLAKGGNLELQPSSEGVVYTAGTGITISNDEISADTTVLATKTDLSDLNTKTFYLSSTSDLTTATAALQWYFAGKNAIIVYRGYAYMIGATTSSSPLVFISTIAISRSSSSPITENWVKNLQIFFNSSHNATVILDSSKYNSQSFLETGYNYTIPYTPEYAGSPATKKYVDDNVVQKSATAPSSPTEGMVWYDTTNDILKAYDGTHWNVVGNGDMAYADFNWVTKTGATVTLDFNSVIEPSANFTVNAPSTIKDGQIYILRVESGATAYTMTLGTGITNPYSESTTLTANKIKLFTFLAIDGNLELQPSVQGGGIISSNNTYEDIVYLSQSAYDALATKDPNTLYSTPEGDAEGFVDNTAFGSSWDGVTNKAPSMNAVYDVLGNVETLLSNI